MSRFEKANFQHLTRVVPLVKRLSHVDPVVTLQANQLGFERGSQRFRNLGLSHARLAFNKERPPQAQGEINRNGQAPIGYVQLTLEERLKIVDRSRMHGGCLTHLARARAEVSARST